MKAISMSTGVDAHIPLACSYVRTEVGTPTMSVNEPSLSNWPIRSTAKAAVEPVPRPSTMPLLTYSTAFQAACLLSSSWLILTSAALLTAMERRAGRGRAHRGEVNRAGPRRDTLAGCVTLAMCWALHDLDRQSDATDGYYCAIYCGEMRNRFLGGRVCLDGVQLTAAGKWSQAVLRNVPTHTMYTPCATN